MGDVREITSNWSCRGREGWQIDKNIKYRHYGNTSPRKQNYKQTFREKNSLGGVSQVTLSFYLTIDQDCQWMKVIEDECFRMLGVE